MLLVASSEEDEPEGVVVARAGGVEFAALVGLAEERFGLVDAERGPQTELGFGLANGVVARGAEGVRLGEPDALHLA